MTPKESTAAIEKLFGVVESLLAKNAALELGLNLAINRKGKLERQALRAFIQEQENEFTAIRADVFSWLRETLLSSISETHPQPDLLPRWEEELRRLVDGPKDDYPPK